MTSKMSSPFVRTAVPVRVRPVVRRIVSARATGRKSTPNKTQTSGARRSVFNVGRLGISFSHTLINTIMGRLRAGSSHHRVCGEAQRCASERSRPYGYQTPLMAGCGAGQDIIRAVDDAGWENHEPGQAAGYVSECGEPFYGTRVGPGWYQTGTRVARGCKLPFSVLRLLMQVSRNPPLCEGRRRNAGQPEVTTDGHRSTQMGSILNLGPLRRDFSGHAATWRKCPRRWRSPRRICVHLSTLRSAATEDGCPSVVLLRQGEAEPQVSVARLAGRCGSRS